MKSVFLIATISSFITSSNPYKSFFKSDYDKALEIITNHHTEFRIITEECKVSGKLVKSIVFPEIIRYNTFQNFLEKTALEMMYVDGGTNAVDFSIGYFQMKPSFIESIEKTLMEDSTLRVKYKKVTTYSKQNQKEKRQERLNRLKDINWQITYICAFSDILNEKFKNENLTTKNQVVYYSSAYNLGYQSSIKSIKNWSKTVAFPYGKDYDGKQFTYSEIAHHYYTL